MSHDSTTPDRFYQERDSDNLAKEGIEIDSSDFPSNSNPPISGAYIRSLVKQLTSSSARTRRDNMAMGSRDRDSGDSADSPEAEGKQQQLNSGPPAPPGHKKQVRRRLHTTRPYQERLLNMAEARREIVAALKFHRAAMKQAQQQQQHHQNQPLSAIPQPLHRPPANCMNYQFDASSVPLSAFSYPPPHNPSFSSNQNPYSWPISPISPLPSSPECLNVTLPSQTLGLNLNLRDFDNLYHKGSTTPPSIYSTSLPQSSSSSSISSAVTVSHEAGPAKLAAAVMVGEARQEDEEMRSLAERHQMEWNDDGMNLVKSAWWLEFLKGMEGDEEAVERAAEERCDGSGFQIFDEVMEFPPWLGGGESCLQPHLVDDCFSDEYFQDVTLP